MVSRNLTNALLTLVVLSGSGCASSGKKKTPQVSFGGTSHAPAVHPLPPPEAGAANRPYAVPASGQAVPVYIPPKIVKTVLAPYQDEKGRLFGAQEMYEVIEEGRLNPEALERPDLAYIPPENLIVPPGMGNPVSAPAMDRAFQEAPRLPIDLIDPRDITITGLLEQEENRSRAQRMADASAKRAVFDPDLGWVLVPPSGVR